MSWLRAMSNAARENALHYEALQLTLPPLRSPAWMRLDAVVAHTRSWRKIRYRWAPPQETLSRAGCLARGWAACADAAADIAALAYVLGLSGSVCIEAPEALRGYAHARVIVEGVVCDPYAAERPPIPPSCEYRITFASLLSPTPQLEAIA